MSFSESQHPRATDGKFADKVGTSPDVVLGKPETGRWLYDGNGAYRPAPEGVSPEMARYNEQVAEAKRRADAIAALYDEDMEFYEFLSKDDSQDTVDHFQQQAQQFRDIVAFEQAWVESHDGELGSFAPGDKKSREFARAIRERFDITPVRYVQLLNRVPDVHRVRDALIGDGADEASAVRESRVRLSGGRPPKPKFLTKRQQDEDFDRWEAQHEAGLERGFR